jgi:ribose transport system substrate-binding protein
MYKRRTTLVATLLAVAALIAAGCGPGSDEASDTSGDSSSFDLSRETVGPNGEPATPADEIGELTPEQVAEVREAGYKVAILHGGSSTWFNAMQDGIEEEASRLGVDIVLTTSAEFDAAKQADQVETAMSKSPDAIVTLPVDPVSAAEAFRPAVEQGVKLLFVDNGIDGYEAGKEYVSIVTGDHFGMGRAAAELMVEAIGGEGQIGYIFHDADFYVTNNRDQYFKAVIEQEHPEIEIVDEAGFTSEGATSEIANGMLTQHPDLDGIYVSWSAAATGVLDALRAAGNTETKVVSHDLDATNDLQIAQGENLYGVAADKPYLEGQVLLRLAVLSLLGEETPPFVTVDPVTASQDNLVEAWMDSLNQLPPAEIIAALEQQ